MDGASFSFKNKVRNLILIQTFSKNNLVFLQFENIRALLRVFLLQGKWTISRQGDEHD